VTETQLLIKLAEENRQILANLYWLMFAVLAALFAILFSKIVMHRRLYDQGEMQTAILMESRSAGRAAKATEIRASVAAQEVKDEVRKVPENVVQAITTAQSHDGELPRLPLPPS
jgi:formate hydrogenlyase subunit 3/multisubunit Na+/H+ antiporter MnhD subunit